MQGGALAALCGWLVIGWSTGAEAQALPMTFVWRPLAQRPVSADLADLVPKDAHLVRAQSGELLRLHSKARPVVGRLWHRGTAITYLDESFRLVRESSARDAWRFVVPLGVHTSLVVAGPRGPLRVERAEPRDLGYVWELYEDRLLHWALESDLTRDPPMPPSAQASGVFRELLATARLVGAKDRVQGTRHLLAGLALRGMALVRPLTGPHVRAAENLLTPRQVPAGETLALRVEGPRQIAISARAIKEGAALQIIWGGHPVAGGTLLPTESLPREAQRWVLYMPEGAHRLDVTARYGPVEISARAYRRRYRFTDALTGRKSIAVHLRAARRDGSPLARAEAQRLAGNQEGARAAFLGLMADSRPATRTFAAWRMTELSRSRDASAHYASLALRSALSLPVAWRNPVATAITRTRALRAVWELVPEDARAALAETPELWGEAPLANVLLGPVDDDDGGVYRLAATVAAGPASDPRGGPRSFRRALFHGSHWKALASGEGSVPVRVFPFPGTTPKHTALHRLSAQPVLVEVPADPWETGRFRLYHVLARSTAGPDLSAVLHVDGRDIPVPTVDRLEDHLIALAPGRHRVSADSAATLYLASSRAHPAYDRVDPGGWHLRDPVPAGTLLGLELRLLGAADRVVQGVLEVDGHTLELRYRAPRAGNASAEGQAVTAPGLVDIVASDPSTLRLYRRDPGPGAWLLRPFVRVAQPSAPAPHEVPSIVTPPRPKASLKELGLALEQSRDSTQRATLHLARASLLYRLGHVAYAREDIYAAARLDQERRSQCEALLSEEAHYVDAAQDVAYALDASLGILHRFAHDSTTQELARSAFLGDLARVYQHIRDARARGVEVHPAALALRARSLRAREGSVGAAAAYAELALQFPAEGALHAAEARARLRAATGDPAAKAARLATRAFVAALRAGDAPGASTARALAAEATRWRTVSFAENSAGSIRHEHAPAQDDVRAVLAAPGLEAALWIERGQTARAVFSSPRRPRLRVETRCVELRPQAAAERRLTASCQMTLRVDGVAKDGEGPTWEIPPLAPGAHTLELSLRRGGLDVACAVRMISDREVLGALSRAGEWALPARVESKLWLADTLEPLVLHVLGPTALRLDLVGEGQDDWVRVSTGASPMATLAVPRRGSARAILPLAEERPYRLEFFPQYGRVGIAAAVREDSLLPLPPRVPRLEAAWPSRRDRPLAPSPILDGQDDTDGPGTLTVLGEIVSGEVGERADGSHRGVDYLELAATYRRKNRSVYWLASGFVRARDSDPASFGANARVLALLSPLRLSAGAFAIAQQEPRVVTASFDAALAARLALGPDTFVSPLLGAVVRDLPREKPSGLVLDPDVWSSFDADHPRAVLAELRISHEPFIDLLWQARVRATSNADLVSLDRASASIGTSAAVARLLGSTSIELERRWADRDRAETQTRLRLRLGASLGVWEREKRRFSVTVAGTFSSDSTLLVVLGMSYDVSLGRGLLDFAPPESAFSSQRGPYDAVAGDRGQ